MVNQVNQHLAKERHTWGVFFLKDKFPTVAYAARRRSQPREPSEAPLSSVAEPEPQPASECLWAIGLGLRQRLGYSNFWLKERPCGSM
jgi:hypothetical protein